MRGHTHSHTHTSTTETVTVQIIHATSSTTYQTYQLDETVRALFSCTDGKTQRYWHVNVPRFALQDIKMGSSSGWSSAKSLFLFYRTWRDDKWINVRVLLMVRESLASWYGWSMVLATAYAAIFDSAPSLPPSLPYFKRNGVKTCISHTVLFFPPLLLMNFILYWYSLWDPNLPLLIFLSDIPFPPFIFSCPETIYSISLYFMYCIPYVSLSPPSLYY